MRESRSTDLVFRLGWLEDKESGSAGIVVLQDWVRTNSKFDICSEADTKPVVEAVLRGLGWDTLSGDVAREGDCRLGDFHLYYQGDDEANRKICTLIEAEPLHYNVQTLKGEHLSQLSRYLRRLVEAEPKSKQEKWIVAHRLKRGGMVFAHAVLTNGRRWWIYDGPRGVNDTAPLAHPPSLEFDLLDGGKFDNILSVLGKKQTCAEVERFFDG